MKRPVFLLALWLLAVGCFQSVAAENGGVTRTAENCRAVNVGGRKYVEGDLFLESHADTAQLVALGFRKFVFLGRSVRSVKYRAQWPSAVTNADLPAQITGVVNDAREDSRSLLLKLYPEERRKLLEDIEKLAPYQRTESVMILTLPGRSEREVALTPSELEQQLWLINRNPPPDARSASEKEQYNEVCVSMMDRETYLDLFVNGNYNLVTQVGRPERSRTRGGPGFTRIRRPETNSAPDGFSFGSHIGVQPQATSYPQRIYSSGPFRYSGITTPRHTTGFHTGTRR